ncbi:hypothetical protein OG21DRAFT_1266834 [Imleria badia]|nr:hypothetical protein OG21DRAFT_1266834 [Imleria badia]
MLLLIIITTPLKGPDRESDGKTCIYVGFTAWAVGCGCLSTVRASTSKGLLVVYMLLSDRTCL